MQHTDLPTASLGRQLAAMLYDGFLILAMFFVVLGVFVAFKIDTAVPFADSESVDARIVWLLYLGITFFFYSWFWQKNGQTLGMQVWRIRIVSELGGNPHWINSFLRLVFACLSIACFGLGYLWLLFRPYSWHDKLSQTRVVFIGKNKTETSEQEAS